MHRWSVEDLRLATLRRQFPAAGGVLDLVERLAPIQSQVPRAPFATIAARRPGTTYAELVDHFEHHRLIKASTLRGTVFTSDRQQFAWAERIAQEGRIAFLAGQTKVAPELVAALLAEVEQRAAEWRPWDDLLEHARTRMVAGPPELAARADQVRVLLWGQAGLIRRPSDGAWHKRTDTLRRASRSAVPELPSCTLEEAVTALTERYLRAYGPVTREDICFYLGIRKTPLNRALATLADRLRTREGPQGQAMVDLDDDLARTREPPAAAEGVRLLAEFDGCLLGYAGPGRLRFLSADQLTGVWSAKNAVCAPTVLHDGRIVARWRTAGSGRRVRLEVTMLPPHPPLPVESLSGAATALAAALPIEISDIRVS